MPTETPSADELCVAIKGLRTDELIRLHLVAKVFDPRRHEDLLQEAIARTLSGERKWRNGVTLYWHLHQTMRSIAWAWYKKLDENLVLVSQCRVDDRDAASFINAEAATPDPERQAAALLTLERVVENCGSDPVVVGLLMGKLEGKTGPEIREELSLSEQDFSAAAQRLRRSAKALVRGRRYA